MKQAAVAIIIATVAVVLIGLGYWIFATPSTTTPGPQPDIVSFDVDESEFVVQTRHVDRVEIYGVPAGGTLEENTGATTTNDELIGIPEAVGDEGGVTRWQLSTPSYPLDVSVIYAQGFDKAGKPVARKTLSHMGPQEIQAALWPEIDNSIALISPGDTMPFEGGRVELVEVRSDTRCRKNTECDLDGAVEALFEVSTDERAEQITISSAQEKQGQVGDVIIDILGISPPRPETGELNQDEYRLRVMVFREVKL